MNAVVALALALAILVIGVTATRLPTDILPTFIEAVHAA